MGVLSIANNLFLAHGKTSAPGFPALILALPSLQCQNSTVDVDIDINILECTVGGSVGISGEHRHWSGNLFFPVWLTSVAQLLGFFYIMPFRSC